MPGLKFWPRHGGPIRVSELDLISIAAPRVALCWWGAACNLSPSTMQSSYPVAGFHPVWRRRAYQFTVLRMVSRSPIALSSADVSRVLHTTTLRRDELLIQR